MATTRLELRYADVSGGSPTLSETFDGRSSLAEKEWDQIVGLQVGDRYRSPFGRGRVRRIRREGNTLTLQFSCSLKRQA